VQTGDDALVLFNLECGNFAEKNCGRR
jgi:hypothetical protein